MLAGVSEADRGVALEVFQAARSWRGDKGRSDRLFLEALHYFTFHSVTWRPLLNESGKWNSVWKRFWRLSNAGVFEAFFQMLDEHSPTTHLVQIFDSTVVRAHVSVAGAKGGSGAKRSGAPTAVLHQVHLKADFEGQPLVFELTGGAASDSPRFPILPDRISALARPWATRDTMPRPTVRRRALVASAQ